MTKTPIAVLGIDLGKNSCSLAGMDGARQTSQGVRRRTCGADKRGCAGAAASNHRRVLAALGLRHVLVMMNHITPSDAPCREPPEPVLMGQDQCRLV